ncbi:MAG: UDP-N-acetylmuramate dehydrogenase [Bacillota bacterium]
MDFPSLATLLRSVVEGDVKISESMSRHTTWQIGGPADLFFTPLDIIDLEKALNFSSKHNLPVTIIGGGSNLLIKDEGIRGLVISLCGLRKLKFNGAEVTVQGGVKLPYLARQAADRGLRGLEFASGIPGTVGGAVVMNAGAFSGSISDIVEGVTVMDLSGQTMHFNKEDLQFSYRSSKLQHFKGIVVEIHLKLKSGDVSEIKSIMANNLNRRKAGQPWEYPNAGSVFKNPPGDSAGRLIESIGAKGWQIGRAQVSEKHANFIINLGGASSCDVLNLIEKIQYQVKNQYNILLEPEILVLGGY